MTYLRCAACGFRTVRGPLSLISSCPRCRLRGRQVALTETTIAPASATQA
jgi:predicted Zn-ribbon and HTH transcriptional regulator